MPRKSTVSNFINKKLGGIKIIQSLGIRGDKPKRTWVKCECLFCEKEFEAQFHNVYRGNYKSCGCLQFALKINNPRWKGYGEISQTAWWKIINGAKRRNLSIEISLKEIWELFLKQNKKCALSGIELSFNSSSTDSDGNASLDRIDSSRGYTIDNIQWVHKDINFMKQDFSQKEFLMYCKKISEYSEK